MEKKFDTIDRTNARSNRQGYMSASRNMEYTKSDGVLLSCKLLLFHCETVSKTLEEQTETLNTAIDSVVVELKSAWNRMKQTIKTKDIKLYMEIQLLRAGLCSIVGLFYPIPLVGLFPPLAIGFFSVKEKNICFEPQNAVWGNEKVSRREVCDAIIASIEKHPVEIFCENVHRMYEPNKS